jgi:hypothetical protein
MSARPIAMPALLDKDIELESLSENEKSSYAFSPVV